jgi:osomolarity two-component system response regulator SKN7
MLPLTARCSQRKMPTGKKVTKDRSDSPTMPSAADAADKGAAGYGELKNQVAALTASQDQMSSHINNLTKQYQGVIGEMLTFQRNMVQQVRVSLRCRCAAADCPSLLQDQLMQQLIQYLMQESRKPAIGDGNTPGGSSMQGLLDTGASDSPFVAPETAQSLIGNYSTLARDSFATMSQVSERMAAAQSGRDQMQGRAGSSSAGPSMNGAPNHRDSDGGPPSPKSSGSPASDYAPNGKGKASTAGDRMYFHPPHLNAEDASAGDVFSSALQAPGSQALEHAGLRVYTVGTLQPRSDFGTLPSDGSGSPGDAVASALNGRAPSVGAGTESRPFGINVPSLEELPADMPRVDRRFSTAAVTPLPGAGPQTQANVSDGLATPSDGGQNMLRIRRSTYVPGWAVPPRVLVVDDNDVCRKMSSKFLQVFGCAIDVAVDGVNAVNKMNLEKYDLVLMDIVMPNLDGVSATSLIREFDPRTPIISMTSNSGPKELLNYMSSGMNDILPKPFTKEGLLNMLEKHLIHLKTVQKMDEIPKSFGLPPLSDDALQSVLSATAASAAHLQNGAPSPRGLGSMLGNSAAGASPFAAMMGNGPARFTNADSPEEKNSDDDEGVDNPLAGMGFSDDE